MPAFALRSRFPSAFWRFSSKMVGKWPRPLTTEPGSMAVFGSNATRTTVEGAVTLEVPHSPAVYFNKYDRITRDLKVLFVEAFAETYSRLSQKDSCTANTPLRILDAETGTGAAGIRFAKELTVPTEVVLCDHHEEAADCARANAELNECRSVRVEGNDCRRVLALHRGPQFNFDVIDLDKRRHPFDFIPYTFPALNNGGLLILRFPNDCVPPWCVNRFIASNHHLVRAKGRENLIRAHLGQLQQLAVRAERVIEPLLSLSLTAGILLVLRVQKFPPGAWHWHDDVQVVVTCNSCWHQDFLPLSVAGEYGKRLSVPLSSLQCPLCKTSMQFGGHAWVRPLMNRDFARRAQSVFARYGGISRHFSSEHFFTALLNVLSQEEIDGAAIDTRALSIILGGSTMKSNLLAGELKAQQYKVGHTHIGPYLIRTSAPFPVILDIMYHVLKQQGFTLENVKTVAGRRLLEWTPTLKSIDYFMAQEKNPLLYQIHTVCKQRFHVSKY